MSKTTTTTERLAALADVAEAAGRLRVALPDDTDLSDLTDALTALTVLVVCGGMCAPERHPLCADTVRVEKRKKPGRKPKTAQVEKAEKPEPTEDAPAAPRKILGVCVECGEGYLKTSNVQKRCPSCAAARKAAPPKDEPAKSDRLARIKAIDKKLDTIPEP